MTEIYEDELFEEIERLRANNKVIGLTDQQFACIKKAREGDNPIEWARIVEWFNARFGTLFTGDGLRKRYNTHKQKYPA